MVGIIGPLKRKQLTMLDLSYIFSEESEESMQINYNNKTYKIPEPFDKCFFGSEPTKELTIHNRFSDETFQQSCKLPSFAVAIYDTIIGAEASEDYKLMQKGITWFQKNFPNQYMTLLD